jgi:hypothetical protein
MSTTRTTSSPSQPHDHRPPEAGHLSGQSAHSGSGIGPPYTVIGGRRWDKLTRHPFRLTILVLGRGDKLFRNDLLKELGRIDLSEIVWVEGYEPSSDIDGLSHDHPDVRLVLMGAPVTAGEKINVGILESRSPLVLCIWSDMRISHLTESLLDTLSKGAAVCTVPVVRNSRSEQIPSYQAPLWRRRRLSLAFHNPRRDGEEVLFPFDFCGFYSKEAFQRVGGYDPSIENPYWQKLDFGFRCHLWGERIIGTTALTATYSGAPPTDDATPDAGYKAFYLKNLAVRFRREMGVLPGWRMLDYMAHSDTGPFYAVKEFLAVREWVHRHRFRFRKDPRDILEGWENA